jgi:hypothetical protein
MDGTRNYALFTPDSTYGGPNGQRNPYLDPSGDGTSIIATSSDAGESADSLKRIADNKAAREAEAAKKKKRGEIIIGPLEALDIIP